MSERRAAAEASGALPEPFRDLEPFVDDWAVAERNDRFRRRFEVPYETIKSFYDAMLPRAPAALDYLNRFPLHDLDACQQRLLRLLLSLVEISRCVELWRAPDMPYPTFDPGRMVIYK